MEKYTLEITGDSYAECPRDIYARLKEIIISFFENNTNYKKVFTINFKTKYVGGISRKYIFETLQIFNNYYKKGFKIILNWHYTTDDIDTFEEGEDLESIMSFPFNLIEISE